MKYGVIYTALMALVLASLPAFSQAEVEVTTLTKVVVAQGVGVGQPEAIADGQRTAVTQCLSLYVKTEAQTVNADLLRESVFHDITRYVQDCQVIAESKTDDGRVSVQVSVRVRLERMEAALDDLWERLKIAGNPRVIVAVEQQAPADVPDVAQGTIVDKLVNLGFKVLDEGQLQQARQKQALKMLRDDREVAASVLALQDRADIVIVGRATARQQDTGVAAFSCQGAVDARAIRTDTAQIVTATRSKATKAGFTEEGAAESALEQAGGDWVAKNLRLLVRAVIDPCKEYTVAFTNCTHDDVTALDAKLAALPAVRATDLLAFDKGLAQLSVQYRGSIMAFSKELAAIRGIEVESTTANTVRINKVKTNR